MIYQCNLCKEYFTRSYSLKRHIDNNRCSKMNQKKFFCEICSIKFRTMKQKKKHDIEYHNASSKIVHICDICGKIYKSQKNLKFHLITHKSRKMKFKYYDSENDIIIPKEIVDNEIAIEEMRNHWSAIRNFTITGEHKLRHVYNIRLEEQNIISIKEKILEILSMQKEKYKINASFGSLLYNIENKDVRYFHASQNNFLIFEKPREIGNKKDEEQFISDFFESELHDLSLLKRENTKWRILIICNVTLYIFRMLSIPFGSINKKDFPSYIIRNRGVNLFFIKNGNLCFFECLAQYQKRENIIVSSRKLCEDFTGLPWIDFKGVMIEDVGKIEKYYNIPIYIYFLQKDKNNKTVATIIRRSPLNSSVAPLNINIFRNHFMFIHSIEKFCKWISCKKCSFKVKSSRKSFMIRHEYNCGKLIKEQYPGGIYKPQRNIFELLENEGIIIPLYKRQYRYKIFYDCESILIPVMNCVLNSKTISFTQKHEIISIAFCSNVPNYEKTECLVREINQTKQEFIKIVMDKLMKISNKCSEINMKKFEEYLFQLSNIIKKTEISSKRRKYLESLSSIFQEYIYQIPILAFNSKRYDLPLFLSELISYFLIEDQKIPNVIKHNNQYKAILTKNFRFLDISNYLSPGISYAQYLKAFNVEESKFFFPYEYLTSIGKLSETTLPPHSAFYSSLKQKNISNEEYELCKVIWEKNKMKTLKDFLIYYNTMDVAPGLKAIDRHMELLYKLNVDPLKETFSISGVAFLYLFRKKFLPFSIFNNGDLFKSVKNSLIGGPSIIFKRYAKVDETFIKQRKYGDNAKIVKKIVGFDANSLYLSVLKNILPTGFMIHRKAPYFNPKIINSQSFDALCWMEYISKIEKVTIFHALYLGEIKVCSKNIPVDGYFISSVGIVCLQYQGCFIHGHDCYKNKKYSRTDVHPFKKNENLSFEDVYNTTLENNDLIIKDGYILKQIWECEWINVIKTDKNAEYIVNYMKSKKSNINACSETELIKAIKNEKIFGLVQCDINVPENLKQYFEELTPIFKNVDISINDIGETMKKYCLENDLLKQPRKQLIGSYFGEKLWIMSPLAKWYMDKGINIKKIYQFLEFDKSENFSEVVDEIIKFRRLGDIDKKYEMIGGIFKLIGNSIYGKSILNKNNIHKISYCFNENSEKYIRSPYFMNMNEIGNDISEIEMNSRTIKQNIPLVLGFSILNYAKGVLLSFFYDFIKKYIPDDSFELMETDTDSLYMCLSEENLAKTVPIEKKKSFYNDLRNWMPVKACNIHYESYVSCMMNDKQWHPENCCILEYKRESRTPGKWKIEAEGEQMICLNSKTYILNSKNSINPKISSKGLSKTNSFSFGDFSSVLSTQKGVAGENRGFKITPDKSIYSYKQKRTGLSYLYIKRIVLEDGISTIPLNL